MKKLILSALIAIIITGCAQQEDKTEPVDSLFIKELSEACFTELKNDTYIQACNDIVVETNLYVTALTEQKVDFDRELYTNMLNNLTLVTDVSSNRALVKKTEDLILEIAEALKPIILDQKIITYKDVEDDKDFSTLANSYLEKTNLEYLNTEKIRNSYDSEDFVYRTTFMDENLIRVCYYTDMENNLIQIVISNNHGIKNVFYNEAYLYSKFILMDEFGVSRWNAEYDAILVEKHLQFENVEQFRTTSVEIIVEDETVTIRPL